MFRAAWLGLLSLLALLAVPAAAQAANVTVAGGTITFNAGAGETNTAVIVKQQTTPVATIYFVGDQNPDVTVTASPAQGCLPTPPVAGLPEGFLCTVPNLTPITSLVENLGDLNDTGVISAGAAGPPGTIDGGAGDDTLVGAQENDTFLGRAGIDSVAYVGISAASITRTSNVTAVLPTGAFASSGNGQAGENDSHWRRCRGPHGRQRRRQPDRQRRAEHDRRLRAPRHAGRESAAPGHGEHGRDQRRGRRRHAGRGRQRHRERRGRRRHRRRRPQFRQRHRPQRRQQRRHARFGDRRGTT